MKRVVFVLTLAVCVVRGDDLRQRIEDAVEALERGLYGDEQNLEGDEQLQAPEERGVDTETGVEKRGVYYMQSGFDQEQSFSCDHGLAINVMMSNHLNRYEDRLWSLACKPDGLSGQRHCSWTGWVNDLDAFFNFDCNHSGYIAGMESQHHNGTADRRYKFYCCHLGGSTCHRECHETAYTDLDAPIRFIAPSDKLLTGVQSYHDNGQEDRRFKFSTCSIQPC